MRMSPGRPSLNGICCSADEKNETHVSSARATIPSRLPTVQQRNQECAARSPVQATVAASRPGGGRARAHLPAAAGAGNETGRGRAACHRRRGAAAAGVSARDRLPLLSEPQPVDLGDGRGEPGPVRRFESRKADGRERLQELFTKTFPRFRQFEPHMRAALQLSLEHWALERSGRSMRNRTAGDIGSRF